MRYRPVRLPLALVLAAGCGLATRGAAQGAPPSFAPGTVVPGTAADEAAIRAIIAAPDSLDAHTAADVDWENAFGGRFTDRARRDAFMKARLAPTMTAAADTTFETKVRFVTPAVAVADVYWKVVGQRDPERGTTLPDRWIRTTLLFTKAAARWTLVLQRIADLRAPWYPHFTALPPAAAVAPAMLARYAGTYQAPSRGTYVVAPAGDRLTVRGPDGAGVAIPRSATEFYYFRNATDPGNHRILSFAPAPDGTLTLTEAGPGNDRPIALRRVP